MGQKQKFVGITLDPSATCILSDTQKFCTASSRKTCFGGFVRQRESCMFLRKCSEREKPETLQESTRVEEVWRVVRGKPLVALKLKSFLIELGSQQKHLQGRMPEKSQIRDTATWLILPVVICLSQRLSHACLSSSKNKVKPRMAHYISYGSLDRTYYLDNCGNSRANTCNELRPLEEALLLDQSQSGLRVRLTGDSE